MKDVRDGSVFCQQILLVIVIGMAGAIAAPILLPLFLPEEKVAQREAMSLLHNLYPKEAIREVRCVRAPLSTSRFDCVAVKDAPNNLVKEIKVRCSIKSRKECSVSNTSS